MSKRPLLTKMGLKPQAADTTPAVSNQPADPPPSASPGSSDGGGVSPGPHTAPTPELNPRTAIMKQIAERYEQRVLADAAETAPSIDEDGNTQEPTVPDDGETTTTEPDVTPPQDAVDAAPDKTKVDNTGSEPPKSDSTDPFNPDDDYEIVVDGQKVTVKGAQILAAGVRTLQKDSAADMRLEAASRMLREAGEKLKAAEGSTTQPKGVDSGNQGQSQPSDQEDAELARAIQFGSEEDAVRAISKLRQSGRGQSSEEVVNFVFSKIGPMLEDQMAYKAARDSAIKGYPEIFSNPMLKNLFISEESRLRDVEKDSRPYAELYPAIAENIIKTLKIERITPSGSAPASAAPSSDATSITRVIRKSQASGSIAQPSSGSAPKKDVERPLTTAEFVREQQRLRGNVR